MRLWERENNRNTDNEALFRAMVTAAYPDVKLVVAGHHIFYQRGDGPPEEIPSADALIFDHTIAKAVWGDEWLGMLALLAGKPAEERDAYLRSLYSVRKT